jgi:hypothetical protein
MVLVWALHMFYTWNWHALSVLIPEALGIYFHTAVQMLISSMFFLTTILHWNLMIPDTTCIWCSKPQSRQKCVVSSSFKPQMAIVAVCKLKGSELSQEQRGRTELISEAYMWHCGCPKYDCWPAFFFLRWSAQSTDVMDLQIPVGL